MPSPCGILWMGQLECVIFENSGNMFLLERKPIVLRIRQAKNIEFGIVLLTFCGFSCRVCIKENFVFFCLEGFAILCQDNQYFVTQIRSVYKTMVIF